ncbi:MAG: hypothetical protein B6D41_16570 [Chloroflexi bacterium UTCFX4]|jgi:predicted nucleic acid-binding protein|nr:MAG: hypothetical protein B6D41_16570 [Chloroflexi bacterium UTCFX4]
MVVIDTDVFLIQFAFHYDTRQAVNAEFLAQVETAEPAITVYNLMELLGQLSFNTAPSKLDDWREWFVEVYNLSVIAPVNLDDEIAAVPFKRTLFDEPYAKMRAHRMGYMDALALNLAEQTPDVTSFVTWNAKHFKNKTTLAVYTPQEYLAR